MIKLIYMQLVQTNNMNILAQMWKEETMCSEKVKDNQACSVGDRNQTSARPEEFLTTELSL